MSELQNGAPLRSALARFIVYPCRLFRTLFVSFIIIPGVLLMAALLYPGHLTPAEELLNEAEVLVRNTPDGMVRGCAPDPVTSVPAGVTMSSLSRSLTAAPVTRCQPALIPREAWLKKQNRMLFSLWLQLGLAGALGWVLMRAVFGATFTGRDKTCR